MDINQPTPNNSQPSTEPPQEPGTETKTKLDTKTLILGLAGLAVLVAGVITFASLKSEPGQPQELAPQNQNIPARQPNQQAQKLAPLPEEDSSAAISQQLDDVIVTDLDNEFKSIDADLNQL